jgi:hypothetical protein
MYRVDFPLRKYGNTCFGDGPVGVGRGVSAFGGGAGAAQALLLELVRPPGNAYYEYEMKEISPPDNTYSF